MIPWLEHPRQPLPPTSQALGTDSDAPGLLAAGGELTTERLTEAYLHGVFPWYGPDQPVRWWAPDPRMVLPVAEFRLSRSLRKTVQRFIASADGEVRIDGAFRRVVEACGTTPRAGQDGSWIVPEMVDAYSAWHRAGRVHSVETWVGGELAGGLYGVSFGRMFFGESMFSHRTDASKVALVALMCFCRANGIGLVDCQQNTAHLASFGAREVPREVFEGELRARTQLSDVTDWTYHGAYWAQLAAMRSDSAAAAAGGLDGRPPAAPGGKESGS